MVRTFQCDGCGSSIAYKPGTNETACPKCGKRVNVSTWNVNMVNGTFSGKLGPESNDTSGAGVGTVKCPACGGELNATEFTSATVCPYCESAAIIESNLQADYKPSRIVPFGFNKEDAKKKFKNWSKKGLLTPGDFKTDVVMNQVQGIYMPYWLFSYDVNVEMQAETENKTTERDGDTEKEITETYRVERNTMAHYESVPYGASNDTPGEPMAIIEPFEYEKMTDFSTPYLVGFEGEKHARLDSDIRSEAKKELEEDAFAATKETITGYDNVNVEMQEATFSHEKTEYVLMPVYKLDYQFRGKKFPIYMNGQTGKIAGKLPTSKLRGLAYFGAALGIVALICALISILLIHKGNFGEAITRWWVWLIIGFIIGGIAFLITKGKQSGFGRYSRRNYMEGKKVTILSKNDRLVNTQTVAHKIESGK